MLLYHGTSERVAKKALDDGILPRRATGSKGNWEHSVNSRSDCVYLTQVYAPYFANCATDKDDGRWAIIEVDTARIDDTMLLPDEDYMEQTTRKAKIPRDSKFDELRTASTIKDRTERMMARNRWFRKNLNTFWDRWEGSLAGIGNCCLMDEVWPTAITQVSYFDIKSNPAVMMAAGDPMITLLSYRIMRPKYDALTRWFMGEEVDPGVLLGGFSIQNPSLTDSQGNEVLNLHFDAKQRASAIAILAETSGLEVVRLREQFLEEAG